MNLLHIVFIYLVSINVVTFFMYGIDKWKAKKSRWRIRETALLGLAVLGGSIGAWLGMKVWHHKTQHKKFRFGVPAIIIIQLSIIVYLLYKWTVRWIRWVEPLPTTGKAERVWPPRASDVDPHGQNMNDPLRQNKIDPWMRLLFRGFFVVLCYRPDWRINVKLQNSMTKLRNLLRCYAIGMSIKSISSAFHVSRNTVRKYVRRYQKKLEMQE